MKQAILNLFISSLKESITIIFIIFILMILIELFILKYKSKIIKHLKKIPLIEYSISSFFGIIPGCIGTFVIDSLYMSGFIGFGGIIAVMIATSGDEALILISMGFDGRVPLISIFLITLSLFILGILGGFLAEKYKKKTNLKLENKCNIKHHKKVEFKFKHFIKEHIYKHIIKKHILKLFFWIFGAIFLINIFNEKITVALLGINIFYLLFIVSLIGLLPISGPNIFLVILYSQGSIPFSILLTNSIIQDGHGLLPIIGFSIKDATKIKLFNFIFGITIGLILLLLGL